MKNIHRIVLKDAKILSLDEMKHLFGGSGASMTSCSTDCGSQPSKTITDCIGTCTAISGESVICSGATKVLIKNCNGKTIRGSGITT